MTLLDSRQYRAGIATFISDSTFEGQVGNGPTVISENDSATVIPCSQPGPQYVCRTRFDLDQYPNQIDIPAEATAAAGSLVNTAISTSAIAMKPVSPM